jgi:hypothetical protein
MSDTTDLIELHDDDPEHRRLIRGRFRMPDVVGAQQAVAGLCSVPTCRNLTVGPRLSDASNLLWVCCNCHKRVDDDEVTYPPDLLYRWKADARAYASALRYDIPTERRVVFDWYAQPRFVSPIEAGRRM